MPFFVYFINGRFFHSAANTAIRDGNYVIKKWALAVQGVGQ